MLGSVVTLMSRCRSRINQVTAVSSRPPADVPRQRRRPTQRAPFVCGGLPGGGRCTGRARIHDECHRSRARTVRRRRSAGKQRRSNGRQMERQSRRRAAMFRVARARDVARHRTFSPSHKRQKTPSCSLSGWRRCNARGNGMCAARYAMREK